MNKAEIYPSALEAILAQRLDWAREEFCVALVQKGYEFSEGHKKLADLGAFANGSSDPLETCCEGKQARAALAYVLAARQAYSDQIVAYRKADGALVAWSRLPAAVQPVRGQRVDVSWPDDCVFAL